MDGSQQPLNGRILAPGREETLIIPQVEHDPESEYNIATRSSFTQNAPLSTIRPDAGYLMKGWRRVLITTEGKGQRWCYTQSAEHDPHPVLENDPPGEDVELMPQDLYKETDTFPDATTTVQVVEFRKDTPVPAKWLPPMTDPSQVTRVLGARPEYPDAWRWIHCEGLHGETLKAVANATGWNERKFGGIFTWTRASMEYADDVILVHFKNQGTRLFIWYGGGKYREHTCFGTEIVNHLNAFNQAVFITCSTLNPGDASVTRILDFVDRGCSRPEIVLRKDPTLMFYGIVRAVIQDLRFSVHHVGTTMKDAFKRVSSQPSQSNLLFFYHLQDRLFILSLDTTSLKSAAINLNKAAEDMHNRDEQRIADGLGPDPNRLISDRTRFMLNDQMGLINLLSQELPDVSSRTEAIVNLAFNTLAFRTNNLLQLLAVITLASLPLTIVTGILGIQYFDDTRINGDQIVTTLSIVGGAVLIGLVWFGWWFLKQYRGTGDDGSHLDEQSKRKQTATMSIPQTVIARQVWAKAQDLERDNRIVEEKAAYDPMMKHYHAAHSPRSTIYPPLPTFQPETSRRRQTFRTFENRSPQHNRRAMTTAPSNSPEAIVEEGRSSMSKRPRQQQSSPVTSFESQGPRSSMSSPHSP